MPLTKLLCLFAASFLSCVEICFGQSSTPYWKQTNGPPGGFVNTLAVNTHGHLFAGTWSGIFRTTNDGEHWTWLNTRYNIHSIAALAINSQGHIFAGADLGLFRSVNNGETWAFINSSLQSVSFIGVAPNDHIFAGNYRSIDNGNTWMKTNLPVNYFFAMALNRNGHLFVGAERGVYRSVDEGQSWHFFALSSINVYVISLAFDADGNVLAGTMNGVYLSTDNGETWQQTSLSNTRVITLGVNEQDHYFAATEDFSDLSVTTHLFRSIDHGDSWVRCDTLLPKQAVSALAFGSNGEIFAGMKGPGVFRSTDKGQSWATMNLNNSEVSSLALDSQGQVFAGTREGNGGLFRSDNRGENWEGFGLNDYTIRSLAINSRGHFFVAVHSFDSGKQEQLGVYRSTDRGETWTLIGLESLWIGALAVDSQDRIFAALDGDYLVFHSADGGMNWTESKLEGLPAAIGIRTLAVNADDHVFVGTEFSIFRSTNHGESWVELKTGLTQPDIRAIAVNSQGHIFFGAWAGARGIYRSTDEGVNWERRSQGLTNGFVISLAINAHGDIFAGTDGSFGPPGAAKVFRSTDNGESWAPISDGSGQEQITSLVIDSRGYLFGGTIHGGVFRSEASTTAVREKNENLANSFSLLQNYPNPFNPSTNIRYDLPQAVRVKLVLYNLLGEKVRTLVDASESAGAKQVTWNGLNDRGTRVASGIYVYRLEAGTFTATRKLLLMK